MTENKTDLLPCPQWKIDLIDGFPWETDDPDEDLQRSYAAYEAGLLDLFATEKGSNEEYEYGENVFRLTALGKQVWNTRAAPERSELPADKAAALEEFDRYRRPWSVNASRFDRLSLETCKTIRSALQLDDEKLIRPLRECRAISKIVDDPITALGAINQITDQAIAAYSSKEQRQ